MNSPNTNIVLHKCSHFQMQDIIHSEKTHTLNTLVAETIARPQKDSTRHKISKAYFKK